MGTGVGSSFHAEVRKKRCEELVSLASLLQSTIMQDHSNMVSTRRRCCYEHKTMFDICIIMVCVTTVVRGVPIGVFVHLPDETRSGPIQQISKSLR